MKEMSERDCGLIDHVLRSRRSWQSYNMVMVMVIRSNGGLMVMLKR